MVGERREVKVGGGWREEGVRNRPLVSTEHLPGPGPSAKHMAKSPALLDLTC